MHAFMYNYIGYTSVDYTFLLEKCNNYRSNDCNKKLTLLF